jgi:hypothetical protein
MSRIYNVVMLRTGLALVACIMVAAWEAAPALSLANAQTPQPFPRGEAPRPAQPAPQNPPAAAPARPADPNAPPEIMLGFPIYPNAQFIASYDAGRGQRYYIFGTAATFAELVAYYKTVLKERGTLVFEQPPTHMFEVGRFREETMAFPPGVTIKDYTWGGSAGYPNPKRGTKPERFPTIIMIVPAPPPAPKPGDLH